MATFLGFAPLGSSPFLPASGPARVMLQMQRAGAQVTAGHLLLLRPAGDATTGGGVVALMMPGGGAAGTSDLVRCAAVGAFMAVASDDDDDYEAFLKAMESARTNHRSILVCEESVLLEDLGITAKDSVNMLGRLVERSCPLSKVMYEEVVNIGRSFVEVEEQCAEGYVRADSLVAAMEGLQKITEIFAGGTAGRAGLKPYASAVPVSEKGDFFWLAKAFHFRYFEVMTRTSRSRYP